MEITCGRCRRAYYVPDDLVAGGLPAAGPRAGAEGCAGRRIIRAKCSRCGHVFAVDVSGPRGGVSGLPESATASALPGLAEDLGGRLSWLDAAAARAAAAAAEDQVLLLTVRRSRRSTALALAAGAALFAAAAAGLALWASTRPRSAAPARAHSAAMPGGPVHEPADLDRAPTAAPPPRDAGPAAAPAAGAHAPAQPPAPRPRGLAGRDRRLLDLLGRKEDAAVGAAADERAAASRSQLDPEVAGRVVAENRTALDACISKALKAHPDVRLARRATLVVTVDPAGTVGRARVLEDEVEQSELGACLSLAARRMVFPAFDGEPLDVAVPLSLSATY